MSDAPTSSPARSRTSRCPGPRRRSALPRTVVLDAFEAREPVPERRRRSGLRLALGVAGAAVIAGVAVASPGSETIRQLVRDAVVAPKAAKLPAAPMRLPGGGSLLVRAPDTSPSALWVVHGDGSRKLLGRTATAPGRRMRASSWRRRGAV